LELADGVKIDNCFFAQDLFKEPKDSNIIQDTKIQYFLRKLPSNHINRLKISLHNQSFHKYPFVPIIRLSIIQETMPKMNLREQKLEKTVPKPEKSLSKKILKVILF